MRVFFLGNKKKMMMRYRISGRKKKRLCVTSRSGLLVQIKIEFSFEFLVAFSAVVMVRFFGRTAYIFSWI